MTPAAVAQDGPEWTPAAAERSARTLRASRPLAHTAAVLCGQVGCSLSTPDDSATSRITFTVPFTTPHLATLAFTCAPHNDRRAPCPLVCATALAAHGAGRKHHASRTQALRLAPVGTPTPSPLITCPTAHWGSAPPMAVEPVEGAGAGGAAAAPPAANGHAAPGGADGSSHVKKNSKQADKRKEKKAKYKQNKQQRRCVGRWTMHRGGTNCVGVLDAVLCSVCCCMAPAQCAAAHHGCVLLVFAHKQLFWVPLLAVCLLPAGTSSSRPLQRQNNQQQLQQQRGRMMTS